MVDVLSGFYCISLKQTKFVSFKFVPSVLQLQAAEQSVNGPIF